MSSASVAELVAELESRFPDGEPPPGTVEHVVFLRHEVRLAAVRLEQARAKLRASIRSRESSRPPLTLIQGGRDDSYRHHRTRGASPRTDGARASLRRDSA